MYRFNSLARYTSTYQTQHFHSNTLLRSLSFTNSTNSSDVSQKTLPPELPRNILRLACKSIAKGGVCDVYVVGTSHDSPKSCREVKDTINILKPQVIFLELCPSRTDMLEQQDEVFCEFRVANEEAKKVCAKVVLGDRPYQTTLRRLFRKLIVRPPWHLIKSLCQLPFQINPYLRSTKELKDAMDNGKDDEEAIATLIELERGYFPILIETIVDERDQYMSAMLLKVASKHNLVVAVVGRGHLPGIHKCWKQNIEVEQRL